ncbi:MAG: hypothetical protein A2504_03250 [Bdellovibrionales bacterium RIFOXYD12_FULL_39_22]|nr:MAG: hypothetical protein A2385_15660 [Bdellovibrionales bacterium RIFOXYB1_FULL_39_21]OFZ41543.1 MAG: hypothetical protein A2485_02350 [Bdellovibrionales bacterium RIFOXYC12_FULL_39_17]OFZ45856.1 MAG: hypothetical protein A2404_12715 [Bdellovibrionales bacterium RIFOXYC1_FULL_39_130]OFZ74788.1 MAG: hypothetical protein A2560_10145 [Bdellovibrionales bacterium RIFOXYD1_FULL_39_84]OFZ92648.1 MAG: hypothetical protein A2504_03250 [Bdellovibrionales bacterium RIFOXYD12_FULL_39_22]HLE11305.1 cl
MNCLFCGDEIENDPNYSDCRDYYLQSPTIVSYAHCKKCNNLQQNPIPKNIDSFYHAYPIHKKKHPLFSMIRNFVGQSGYCDVKNKFIQGNFVVIDYGCGDGSYLRSLQKNKKLILIGYDKFKSWSTRENETNIIFTSDKFFLKNNFKNKANIITLHHVFEHLPNPAEVMTELRSLLADDGIIYILIPSIESLIASKFKKRWHGLDAPRHLHLVTERGLRIFLAPLGFFITKTEKHYFSNDIPASISSLLFGKFNNIFFYMLLPISILFGWAKIKTTRSIISFEIKKITTDKILRDNLTC